MASLKEALEKMPEIKKVVDIKTNIDKDGMHCEITIIKEDTNG